MKLKRLTAEDFDRLAAGTRMGDRAREMARAVLVDGRAQADVATEHGMSKQRINLAVAVIERAYLKAAAPGSGWVNVSLELPESLAFELASVVQSMKSCADEERRDKALSQVLRSLAVVKRSLM